MIRSIARFATAFAGLFFALAPLGGIACSGKVHIEITESGVVLHAEADLTIDAPGRRLLIRADTIDFERG